jgi:DNA-binding NarL/FixJ family response regulator
VGNRGICGGVAGAMTRTDVKGHCWQVKKGKTNMYADTNALYIAFFRNCHRCGVEFRADQDRRVCTTCRKPKIRAQRPRSKRLTLRENQLVDLITQGKANKEIAFQLHLSEGTIKTYLCTIFQKVGVTNRTELAVWSLTQRENAA